MLQAPPAKQVRDGIGRLIDGCHNEEAEQALLSALLHAPARVIDAVGHRLQPEHFWIPVNGRIYAAARELQDQGTEPSVITLRNRFASDADLAAVGGAQYLTDLAGSIASVRSADDYADVIIDAWKRRRALDAFAERLDDLATVDVALDRSADRVIADTANALESVADEGQSSATKSLAAVLDEVHEHIQAARNGTSAVVEAGLTDLDEQTGGFWPGDLIILGGRPAMGKSTLGRNIARAVARRQDKAVAFFSLEMTSAQVGETLLQRETGIDVRSMRRGDLTPEQGAILAEASSAIRSWPLYIDDTAGLSVDVLLRRCRQIQRTAGLALVVVDYLQLMRDPRHRSSRDPNRVQEVSAISEGLKNAAKDLGAPILALAQLSRSVEQRADKRPLLADLRESGSIEQDADMVMFIYRDEYYVAREQPGEGDDDYFARLPAWQERMERCKGVAEVIVAKNRFGETGMARLHFDPARGRFDNLARGQ